MARDTLLGFPAHTLPYRRGKFITLSTASAPTAFAVGTVHLSHPQGRSNIRVEIDRGILGNTVLPDLEMKVRTGGPSRAAYGGDRRPRLYRIALVHIHLAARGVQRGESIAVVDHQVIPAFRVKAGLRHGAVRRRQPRRFTFFR